MVGGKNGGKQGAFTGEWGATLKNYPKTHITPPSTPPIYLAASIFACTSLHRKSLIYHRKRPLTYVVSGLYRVVWWSWGDLNPRPQALFRQIYMFSGLI